MVIKRALIINFSKIILTVKLIKICVSNFHSQRREVSIK